MAIREGDSAPQSSLLAPWLGTRTLVLYFYPKDFTPG